MHWLVSTFSLASSDDDEADDSVGGEDDGFVSSSLSLFGRCRSILLSMYVGSLLEQKKNLCVKIEAVKRI